MDTPLQLPALVALKVTLYGDLVVLAAGERLDPGLSWQARTDRVELGERLLRLAAGDGPLAADLQFGRDLARRVLRAIGAAPPGDVTRVAPGPEELAALLAAAPALEDRVLLGERSLAAAWREVVRAVDAEIKRGKSVALVLREHGLDPELGRICVHLAEHPADAERPFAFLATLARSRDAEGRVLHLPLSAALAELAGDPLARQRLLAPLVRAAARNAHLGALLDSHELFHAVAWTSGEAHAFLRAAPDLEAVGVLVRVPPWWHHERDRPQVRVQLGSSAPSLGLAALLDFQLRYFVGEDELSVDEWRTLMQGAAGLVQVRGRWIELDPERHAEAMRHWEGAEAAARRGAVGFAEGMRLLAGLPRDHLDAEVAPSVWTVTRPGPWLAEMLAALQSPRGTAEADPGPALRGVLRPYQRDGVAWLWLLARLGLGGCLADDMGLGKTIQVIALLLLLRKHGVAGPHLIVLPASLLGNWRAELERFAPSLRIFLAHRGSGEVDTPPPLERLDVVLTTYGTLLRQPWMQEQQWGLVALDEAQAIKNPLAKQTRAVKALRSRHRLVLTGTPVENSLADLWSLFDFSSPGLLGGLTEFKRFCRRLGADGRERNAMEPLRALVRPYILRRLKTDRRVIADLPDKTELQVYCGLTRVQAALYAKAVESLAREVAGSDGIRRRGIILAYLTRFKQICNHPSQLSRDGRYRASDSAKFLRLQELCAPIAEAGEKLLVFTQFREIVAPLAELLAGCFGRPGLVLHGGTPVGKRAEIVAEFQRDEDPDGAVDPAAPPGPPFMVLSLRAGGTGLNLTAAGHVIHFDRWWNPAVENQATDRAYRIGQHKNVLVHKFVCRGTLEERIDAMLHDKQGLADGVLVDDGERRLTELGTDELLRVVALDLRSALGED